MIKQAIALAASLAAFSAFASAQTFTVSNGSVSRTVSTEGGKIVSTEYLLEGDDYNFCAGGTREFSFLVNDRLYCGLDCWTDISARDTSAANGMKGVILSFYEPSKAFKVELSYLTYPDLPLVRKFLKVQNLCGTEMKLEGVNVEDFNPGFSETHAVTRRNYARDKAFGPYHGDWDDPLVVVDDQYGHGIAVGNEGVGIIKRTDVFDEGHYIRAGVTRPGSDYPFRRWLSRSESWRSAGIFTAPYVSDGKYSTVVNTTVQAYVHKYMGTRIETLQQKPLFVYNTWIPFTHGINEELIYELAEATAECGVDIFIIDDGWQTNEGCSDNPQSKWMAEDWDVNREKFPNGLKPVFNHIKSLGMKPGLWLSMARLDRNNKSSVEHSEWFVVGPDGNLTDLHTASGNNYTACLGTDWCDYIRETILRYVREYDLAYAKLDLSIVTSAYVYDPRHTGCYATNHPYHKDHEESYDVIYERCMQLFDDIHKEAPELFIDCTFETAGKLQLMDYGLSMHAEGNWLSNVGQAVPYGPMRVRNLGWGRTPAVHPASLVIGNMRMDGEDHLLSYKSLTGTLPIMLGDPRSLSDSEKKEFRAWADWFKGLEQRHEVMSFRQDLPDFGEPQEGCWDGFCRLNTDTFSGGLVGVFRQGAAACSRTVTIPWLDPDRGYVVKEGVTGRTIWRGTGKKLSEKGFRVRLKKEYDGQLYEVSEK